MGEQERELLEQIAETPATAIAGLAIKERAIKVLYPNEAVDLGAEACDGQIAASHVEDLLAMNIAA